MGKQSRYCECGNRTVVFSGLRCLTIGASADGDIDNIAEDNTFISRNGKG